MHAATFFSSGVLLVKFMRLSSAEELTQDDDQPYVVNPPDGLPVVPGELYQNGHCYRP